MSWMRRTVVRRAPGRTAYEGSPAVCIMLLVSAPRARGPRSAGWCCKLCKRIPREPGHHRTNRPGLAPTGSDGTSRVDSQQRSPLAVSRSSSRRRPSLQVVAESNHGWERSEAMIDNRLSEMSSERFLRHNVGRAFCESCLAIHTGLSLQQAAAAVAALGQLSEFVVGSARCLSCGRTNALISATTS
jgi:hypothetical protein